MYMYIHTYILSGIHVFISIVYFNFSFRNSLGVNINTWVSIKVGGVGTDKDGVEERQV